MSGSPTENENAVDAVDVNTADEGSSTGSPSPDESSSDSSNEQEGRKSESLVDRIKAATNAVAEGTTPDPEGNGAESKIPGDPAKAAGEEEKPFTREDLPHLHSKTRKRVEKLLTDVDRLSTEVQTEKQVADRYRGVVGFLKEHDLTMDDANEAFDIMSAMQRNPEEALVKLREKVAMLEKITGAVLPDDLQQQVTQGYITETHAQELSRHRAANARQTVNQQTEQERTETQKVQATQQTALNIQSAISGWESKWASSDPDYQKKRNDVQDELELALSRAQRAGKLPNTPEEAVKFAEDCRKRVESKLGRFQQRPKEIRHVTGSSAGATAHPAPKSMSEAILQRANG